MNFNYFISETVFDYLVEAVLLIAEHGWRLLPDYEFCPETGRWRHHKADVGSKMSLHRIGYSGGRMEYRSRHATEPEAALSAHLAEARSIMCDAVEASGRTPDELNLNADYESLRWFPLPTEIARRLKADAE